MGAKIEWLIGVLRVGKDFKEHGDPWEPSCLVAVEGDVLHLFAIESESKKESHLLRERANIRKILPEGIREIRWERIENAETKSVHHKL